MKHLTQKVGQYLLIFSVPLGGSLFGYNCRDDKSGLLKCQPPCPPCPPTSIPVGMVIENGEARPLFSATPVSGWDGQGREAEEKFEGQGQYQVRPIKHQVPRWPAGPGHLSYRAW